MTRILPDKHDEDQTLPTKEEVLELRDKAKLFLGMVDRYNDQRYQLDDDEYFSTPYFLDDQIFLNDDDTVTLRWEVETEEHEGFGSGPREVTFPLSDFWTLTREGLKEEVTKKLERKRILAEEVKERLERYRRENQEKIELATLKRLQKKYGK